MLCPSVGFQTRNSCHPRNSPLRRACVARIAGEAASRPVTTKPAGSRWRALFASALQANCSIQEVMNTSDAHYDNRGCPGSAGKYSGIACGTATFASSWMFGWHKMAEYRRWNAIPNCRRCTCVKTCIKAVSGARRLSCAVSWRQAMTENYMKGGKVRRWFDDRVWVRQT